MGLLAVLVGLVVLVVINFCYTHLWKYFLVVLPKLPVAAPIQDIQ